MPEDQADYFWKMDIGHVRLTYDNFKINPFSLAEKHKAIMSEILLFGSPQDRKNRDRITVKERVAQMVEELKGSLDAENGV